jgi:hypothetical protein
MGFVKWQLGALFAVLIVGAGAAYGIYSVFTGSNDVDLEADQQLVPVLLGNLVNEVSVNGSIIYPEREALRFSSQGTVAELLVVEGQRVVENDPLASLDSETLANLERSVAQARVDLRDAEEAEGELKATPSQLAIANAEAKVANAEIALSNAIEGLEIVQNPSDLVMAQAEAKVAAAKVALDDAQDGFDTVIGPPSDRAVGTAEGRVATAELSLQSATELLETLQGPASATEVAQAEAKVATANIAVANAQDALDLVIGPPSDLAVGSAEAKVASAELALQSAAELLETLRGPASAFDIAQAQAKLTEAKLVEAKAAESMETLSAGLSPEDLADASQKVESVVDGVVTVNTSQRPLQATLVADTVIRSIVEVSVEDLALDTSVTITVRTNEDGSTEASSVLITPDGFGFGGDRRFLDRSQGDLRPSP